MVRRHASGWISTCRTAPPQTRRSWCSSMAGTGRAGRRSSIGSSAKPSPRADTSPRSRTIASTPMPAIPRSSRTVRWRSGWLEAQPATAGERKLFLAGHSAGAYIAGDAGARRRWLAGARRCRAAGGSRACRARGALRLPAAQRPCALEVFGPGPAGPASQPINHVAAGDPPMLLATGADDRTVRPRNSVALAQRLGSAGVAAELIEYPGLGHIEIVAALAAPLRFLAPVLDDVDAFLRSQPGCAHGRCTSLRRRGRLDGHRPVAIGAQPALESGHAVGLDAVGTGAPGGRRGPKERLAVGTAIDAELGDHARDPQIDTARPAAGPTMPNFRQPNGYRAANRILVPWRTPTPLSGGACFAGIAVRARRNQGPTLYPCIIPPFPSLRNVTPHISLLPTCLTPHVVGTYPLMPCFAAARWPVHGHASDLRPRPLLHHDRHARCGRAPPDDRARPARRRAGLSPVLGGRAPQSAVGGERCARDHDRGDRRGDARGSASARAE